MTNGFFGRFRPAEPGLASRDSAFFKDGQMVLKIGFALRTNGLRGRCVCAESSPAAVTKPDGVANEALSSGR